MRDDTDPSTNRRNLLKSISTGALATTLFAGLASADHTTPDDAGVGAEDCAEVWVEHRCVASDCHCSNPDCYCETIHERRECCVAEDGTHEYCGSWTYVGCCTFC